MKIDTVNILGTSVANMAMHEVLEWVRIMIEQGKPRHIVTANAEILHKAYVEPEFMRVLAKADLITADGSGVMWAAKALGNPISEKVSGVDLVDHLLTLAEEKSWKIYLFGAAPEVVEKAVLNSLSKHPLLRVAGFQHGYYSQQEIEGIVANISSIKPDVILVAMGVPRQELFIQQYLKDLNVPIAIGVGGTFDVMAGVAKRAPEWMRSYGLEWFYRLYKQPSRFRRMLALPKFVLEVLGQRMRARPSSK